MYQKLPCVLSVSFYMGTCFCTPLSCSHANICSLLNVLAVRAYGEAEFWLSGGKVFLILMLFSFTFITMVGGNPKGDAYGFRYWNDPGAFAEYRTTGSLGRFEGFLSCLWTASFAVVGPEYISMVAAESKHPRKYIKTAFKTVYWRFGLFFILGALCVGIITPYNDPSLVAILKGESAGSGTAAASPYVIGMKNLGISVLPDITNALLITSIFSAGNTYTFCATRTLYGLALEGRAPKVLTRCTRQGVPIYCFGIVMLFPFLSFLQVGNGSAKVLRWLTSLITAGGLINFIIMAVTYIFFYRACKAQGLERSTLPYKGWFQPYGAWAALIWLVCVMFVKGYSSFSPFSQEDFWTNYAMVILAPILFFGWKYYKKDKTIKADDADLVWECPLIDQYEARTDLDPPTGFWTEILMLFDPRRCGHVAKKFRHKGEKADV